MDKEDWATVEFNILLEGSLLSLVSVAREESSVHSSEGETHAPVDTKLHQGPEDVVSHCIHHGVPNLIEPHSVEVGNTAETEQTSQFALLRKVGVTEQKQNGSVEELDNKHSFGNKQSLASLGVLSNVHNQLNDEKSEDVVDHNDSTRDTLAESQSCHQIFSVNLADLLFRELGEVRRIILSRVH
jgi:hypothetical protein